MGNCCTISENENEYLEQENDNENENENENSLIINNQFQNEKRNDSEEELISKTKNESIIESKSKNESIIESKLKNESIIESKLKNESIIESKSKNESITESKSKNESIIESKSKNESITESKTKNESITESKHNTDNKKRQKFIYTTSYKKRKIKTIERIFDGDIIEIDNIRIDNPEIYKLYDKTEMLVRNIVRLTYDNEGVRYYDLQIRNTLNSRIKKGDLIIVDKPEVRLYRIIDIKGYRLFMSKPLVKFTPSYWTYLTGNTNTNDNKNIFAGNGDTGVCRLSYFHYHKLFIRLLEYGTRIFQERRWIRRKELVKWRVAATRKLHGW
jgi:hypothetical protein